MRPICRLTAALLCVLCASAVHAQDATTGALSGVVLDPSGAAIAGVSLDLPDPTGSPRHSTTDRLGEFLFVQLAPGTYQLTTRANGFNPQQVEAITVSLGHTTRLRLTQQIGGVSQAVDVTAEPLPTLDSPVNANLSPADLQALPLDGRRFQSLAPLTPLVTAEQTATGTENAQIAVRGLDPSHTRYALDGASLTRTYDGTPRGGVDIPFTIPQTAVQEFQVRVTGEPVLTGRDAGGAINTITRRAEHALHGDAFFLLRNSGVGAANPFTLATRYNNGAPVTQPLKPRDQREQFGGSIGGGLPHSIYALLSAEGQRRSFPAVSSPSDPAFYNLTAVQTALLANRGVSTAATGRALNFLDSLSGSAPRHADEFAAVPRLDWQPGARTAITAEGVHLRFRSPSGGRGGGPVSPYARASLGDLASHADSVLLRATIGLTPRWLATFRAGYSRDASFAQASAPLPQEPQTGPGGAAPQVSIGGTFTIGNASGLGSRRLPDERTIDAAAQFAWNGHAHTVTFGIGMEGVDDRISARAATSGAYAYTNSTAPGRAGALVDFITDYTFSATAYPNGGCPSVFAAVHYFCFNSFTQTFGASAETRFHTTSLRAFLRDGWRLTPHLRVDAGAQYELLRLPPAQHPNAALDATLLTILGTDSASTATTPHDTNNLAPHLAIAYAPRTHTTIRIGYGLHFGDTTGQLLQRALEQTAIPASQVQLRLTPRTIIDPACASAGTNFGYPATFTCTPFGPLAPAGAATVFARGFQLPAIQTSELSISHQIATHLTITAAYELALDRQLANSVDLNIAPSTTPIAFRIQRNGTAETGASSGDLFHIPLYTARRTNLYGPITALLSNGNGTYHALVLGTTYTTPTLTVRTLWTYSKAIDNLRVTGAAPDENAPLDTVEPRYDRAASNFDRRHHIVTSAVWQPHASGHRQAERIATNGWSITPLLYATSGRPYSYNLTGGTALAGGRESLNGSGGAVYLPSVGRNTLRLPWTTELDLRIARTVNLRDGLHLRLTAEAFNLPNHINVTTAEQRAFLIGTPTVDGITPLLFQDAATIASEGFTSRPFGTPTDSANSPTRERRLQFGLRLDW